ncbi:hypothetical protein ILUMI_07113 [Ignelater luminosus]|uniref:Uncharacterized protein n=1 Tax=Ignelater luminosus TaxID=2038154 RepID=A0A8K0D445_IGNLU|nr:hypothetical protein ILUMI_07113 [Ignelater luminosus]
MSRFKASQVKEFNGWLTVLPSKSIGTLLDNSVLRIGIALGFASAVQTLRPWSNSARYFVNELGHRMMVATGDARSKQFFIQPISLAIQRGNAASVIGTFPPSAAMEEIFLL